MGCLSPLEGLKAVREVELGWVGLPGHSGSEAGTRNERSAMQEAAVYMKKIISGRNGAKFSLDLI